MREGAALAVTGGFLAADMAGRAYHSGKFGFPGNIFKRAYSWKHWAVLCFIKSIAFRGCLYAPDMPVRPGEPVCKDLY